MEDERRYQVNIRYCHYRIGIRLQSVLYLSIKPIMPPPSQLMIATSSLNRLIKEEASYHKELEQQQASIAKLEQGGGDENADFQLKQEVCRGAQLPNMTTSDTSRNEPSTRQKPCSHNSKSASRILWPSLSSN